MAAYALEDQKLVHRLLGISRLLAFDFDAAVVARQQFNRPIAACKCRTLSSGVLTADVAGALEASGFDDFEGMIVWLDYTAPSELFTQIREFEKLVEQYRPNDIVRVTVNAEFGYWGGGERINGKMVPIADRQNKAFTRLKDVLGEYFSPDLKPADLGPDGRGVADVIARAFGRAAGRAAPAKSGNILEPLSVTRYADGQQMLSMTAMLVERSKRDAMRDKLGLPEWPFASSTWQDVNFLAVPDLTIRERLYLERHAEASAATIAANVGFDFDAVTEMPGFLENFRHYYRHYPVLSPVEF